MCGRYLFTSPPEAVATAFNIDVRDNFPPRWNVAPTQPVATVHVDDETPIADRAPSFKLMRWGFIPGWAKRDWHERMGAKPLINARGETAAEKPTFRAAWKRRRCLVPADGFYEWTTEAGARQPYCLKPADAETPFGFGGIWETAHDPDGGQIDTVAILTVAAGPGVKALHHREPVVIDPLAYDDWLMADERDVGALAPLLAPRPDGWWTAYRVDKAVGNPRHEGARLAEPIDPKTLFD